MEPGVLPRQKENEFEVRKEDRKGGRGRRREMSPKGYLDAWWENDKRLERKWSLFVFAVLSASKARKLFTQEFNLLSVVAS